MSPEEPRSHLHLQAVSPPGHLGAPPGHEGTPGHMCTPHVTWALLVSWHSWTRAGQWRRPPTRSGPRHTQGCEQARGLAVHGHHMTDPTWGTSVHSVDVGGLLSPAPAPPPAEERAAGENSMRRKPEPSSESFLEVGAGRAGCLNLHPGHERFFSTPPVPGGPRSCHHHQKDTTGPQRLLP